VRRGWARAAGVWLAVGAAQLSATAGVFQRDNFRDTRWVARGNTGVASINDGTSLFYNPAGLARIKGYGLEVLNPSLGANQNFIGSFQNLSGFTSGDDPISTKLLPFLGKPLAMQGNFFPYFHGPGFAAGFWDHLDAGAAYRDPVNPTLDADMRNDWGLIFGGGWELIPGRLYAGASFRYQARRALQEPLTAGTVLSTPSSELTSLFRRGDAYALNSGLQYVQQLPSKTQFIALGLSWEDMGSTAFRVRAGQPKLLRQAQQLNAGVTYGITGSVATIQFLADMRQINNRTMDTAKKLNLGVDVEVANFALRTGLHQGYWTAGTSFYVLPVLSFDLSTYAEEVDSTAGSRQNRYWLIGFRAGVSLEKGARGKKKPRYTLDHL